MISKKLNHAWNVGWLMNASYDFGNPETFIKFVGCQMSFVASGPRGWTLHWNPK